MHGISSYVSSQANALIINQWTFVGWRLPIQLSHSRIRDDDKGGCGKKLPYNECEGRRLVWNVIKWDKDDGLKNYHYWAIPYNTQTYTNSHREICHDSKRSCIIIWCKTCLRGRSIKVVLSFVSELSMYEYLYRLSVAMVIPYS